MKMDNDLRWRRKAQVVAWMDVVLTIIGILMVFSYAYFLASVSSARIADLSVTTTTTEPNKETLRPNTTSDEKVKEFIASLRKRVGVYKESEELKEAQLVMWRQAGFIGVVATIQLCVAFWLRNATKIGRNLNDAFNMSSVWLYCNHIFFLIWLICALAASSYILAYIWLMVRVIFLYVGWNFTVELDAAKDKSRSWVTSKV